MAKIGRDRDNEPLRVGGQQTGLPLAIDELFGQIRLKGFNAAGQPVKLSAETTTGELRIMNTGWNGSAVTRVLLETTGEQKSVLYGKDSGANIDPLRTNADQQLQVEVVEPFGTAVPKILGRANPAATTNTALYNAPTGGTVKVTMISVANRSGSTQTFRVGVDVGGNGTNTPVDSEWFYYDMPILANDTLVLDVAQGLWIGTDDDLVVYASAQQLAFIASGIEYT